MAERYVVKKGSSSGHCCFEYSVMDTTKEPAMAMVCECFDLEDAELVALALNAHEARKEVSNG